MLFEDKKKYRLFRHREEVQAVQMAAVYIEPYGKHMENKRYGNLEI